MAERVRVLAACLALGLVSCVTLAGLRGRAVTSCPGTLVSTREIPGEFLLRERVRITVGDQVIAFQQVVQKRGDELLLIGLHPLGAKLFSVVQRGVDTTIEAAPAPVLEVPPENLLADLHRRRFRVLTGAGPEGEFRGSDAGGGIVEVWDAGALGERRFRPAGGAPVRVRFDSDDDGRSRAVVENPECGYRAEFVALTVD